jgi:hypothetical protein
MNIRGFGALARMHRFRMDEHRRKAMEVEIARDDFLRQDTALEQELIRETNLLSRDDLAMTDFARYSKGIESRREALAKSIAEVTRALARINEQMAIEYREAKKFELAIEREDRRRKTLAARTEQMELDEIGLNYHGRGG